jgi:exosome complex RNA-binding protein Rrp42 (RNase PH superfamily)
MLFEVPPQKEVNSPSMSFSDIIQIGKSLVLDATGTEQACSSSTFSVAVNHTGACCGFNTSLGGHFEAIDIATAVLVSMPHVFYFSVCDPCSIACAVHVSN